MKIVPRNYLIQYAGMQKGAANGGAALAIVALMAFGIAAAAAQSGPAASGDPAGGDAVRASAITVDEEVVVVGQRTLRDFRLELQRAQERIYGLFNSLNSDDQFDIHCRNVPRTGTRIPQRVCEPQYAADSTHDAGSEFAVAIQTCGFNEACLEIGNSRAQAVLSEVPVRGQQLTAEVQRLAEEYPEFRDAIVGYETVARRYQDARRAEGMGLSVSTAIIEPAEAGIPARLTARQGSVVPPQAIELAVPEAAWGRLERDDDREGWLKLRYSVLKDGTTADVRVVDALLPGLDALSVAAAAQSWTFDPAKAQGEAIDWHNQLAIIVFKRERTANARWPEFAAAFAEAAELVAGARFEEAKARNQQMQSELSVTLDEMALAEMQRAAIEHALGNPHAALNAIRRATEPAVVQLADTEQMLALEHRFSLEMELGLAADALVTYERRTGLGRLPAREPMARRGAELEKILAAPETNLAVRGRIVGAGDWEHALTWPVFAVGDVDGAVQRLEVECNRGNAVPAFEEDVQLTIPGAWGECVLSVEGPPNTTFVVYEFKQLID